MVHRDCEGQGLGFGVWGLEFRVGFTRTRKFVGA